MCFDQPRIPKHRILKEHYHYSLSGRKRTSRWVVLCRSLAVILAVLVLLIVMAERSRMSSLQSPSGQKHQPTVRLQ